MSVSTWTIVLATIHRYLAVSRPTIANCETMRKRFQISMLVIWIGSIIYNIPRYFFLDVIDIKAKGRLHRQTQWVWTVFWFQIHLQYGYVFPNIIGDSDVYHAICDSESRKTYA